MNPRSLFFVPVYNQVRELPVVLREIAAAQLSDVDFLLINNGSEDGSEALIRTSGHPFLDVPKNRGVGYSYVLALDWAITRDYTFFGTLAGNAKMLPSEIPRLIDPLVRGEADYVTGSRFLEGGESPHLPSFRRIAIPMVNVVVWLTTGSKVTDATNGFRAFRLELLSHAEFDWHADWLWTYGFEYYLYAKVLRDSHLKTTEVPTTMRYPPAGPHTKIRPGGDWWQMLRPWFKARATPGFSSHDPLSKSTQS